MKWRVDIDLPDTDLDRRDEILSDVPEMRVERLRLLNAISLSTDAYSIAIWTRRVDKIEERFSEAGLDCHGVERAE